jgi:hypothetical protein
MVHPYFVILYSNSFPQPLGDKIFSIQDVLLKQYIYQGKTSFLRHDYQRCITVIKRIHNRELRRSGPIYILQEIPNYQLRTAHDTTCNNLAINCTRGSELELPKPRGAPPHGTPRLAWSPMWVSGYTPTLLLLAKHRYIPFPIHDTINASLCWSHNQ